MCLIILCPSGAVPRRTFVRNAMMINSDGFGMATARDGAVMVSRYLNLSADAAWDLIRNASDAPRMVHFRFRTHGPVDLGNVHPFALAEDAAWAHNGIISGMGDKQRSDSRAFAEDYLSGYGYQDLKQWKRDIDWMVGAGSLTAALAWHNGKGRFVVGRRDEWLSKDGCLWSNGGAFWASRPSCAPGSGRGRVDRELDEQWGDLGLRDPFYYKES